ncbi:polyketide synthase dehydratase domain-containing protein [Chloroflexi bacterium TSY]|nr:polyketide synthase dehydratase domain-containing protein [Chloroflexi bacterium TSY]
MIEQQIKAVFTSVHQGNMEIEDAIQQIGRLKKQYEPGNPPSPTMDRLESGPQTGQLEPERYRYDEPYLKDHRVNGEQVIVGVTHVSLAINTFVERFLEETLQLSRLTFIQPIQLQAHQQAEVTVAVNPDGPANRFTVLYRTHQEDEWKPTAEGIAQSATIPAKTVNLAQLRELLPEVKELTNLYRANPVIELGPSFQTVAALYGDEQQSLIKVALTEDAHNAEHRYALHPLIINSAYLGIMPQLRLLNQRDSYLPFGIKELTFKKTDITACWIWVKLVRYSEEMLTFDAEIMQENGDVAASLVGCTLKRLRTSEHTIAAHHPKQDEDGYVQNVPTTTNLNQADLPMHQANADLSDKIRDYLVSKLRSLVHDPISVTNHKKNLMDLGLDSIQLTNLSRQIEQEAGITLYPTVLFEYPNINELTHYFVHEHETAFQHLFASVLGAIEHPQTQTANTSIQDNVRKTDVPMEGIFSPDSVDPNFRF